MTKIDGAHAIFGHGYAKKGVAHLKAAFRESGLV